MLPCSICGVLSGPFQEWERNDRSRAATQFLRNAVSETATKLLQNNSFLRRSCFSPHGTARTPSRLPQCPTERDHHAPRPCPPSWHDIGQKVYAMPFVTGASCHLPDPSAIEAFALLLFVYATVLTWRVGACCVGDDETSDDEDTDAKNAMYS